MRPQPPKAHRVARKPPAIAWLGAALLALAGCGTPQAPPGRPQLAEPPEPGEQLIAQPPAGWIQAGSTSTRGMRRAEFVPEDEAPDAWVRRITFESLADKPLPDPIEFVELITSDQQRICGTFEIFPTFAGLENGYPTAVNLLVCHRHRETERSEVTMLKTIQGNDHFYIISRARRGPPIESSDEPVLAEEVVAAWSVYLKSVSVCDERSPEHPCPVSG